MLFRSFALFLKWQPSGSRLHLPAFILWAPIISFSVEHVKKKKAIILILISASLICSGVPYVFRNSGRKLYSHKKSTVFNTPRLEQYFAYNRDYIDSYRGAVRYVKNQSCSQIGLVLGYNTWEYPFWVLMRQENPYRGFRMEHVALAGRPVYPLGEFHPCAVIVKDGDEQRQTLLRELTLGKTFVKAWEERPVQVFLPRSAQFH